MPEYGFYHLTKSPLEQALPRLLEKIYGTGRPALVRLGEAARMEQLDRALWTYGKDSWLPHGTERDPQMDQQPILLTGASGNPNNSVFLVIVDAAPADDAADFERTLELFDGHDADAVEAARARWRWAGEEGMQRVYWQQNERGGWLRKAGDG